ncbi:MAG: hypothetical protein ACFNVO_10545 [Prevotella sp.]
MANKDDEVEDTFCYKLFELGEFDVVKVQELVNYVSLNELDDKEKNILRWIIEGVNSCFGYHKDANDYYLIKNYSKKIEDKWIMDWEVMLNAALGTAN